MRSIEEVVDQLKEIHTSGFVPSKRRGATGVGHTLEQLLGISENNFIDPDLGEVELKATRLGSQSMITLFTLDRNCWMVPQSALITQYGIRDGDRRNFYLTVSKSSANRGVQLDVDKEKVSLVAKDGTILAVWPYKLILSRFHSKVRHLLLVTAESQLRNGTEFLHYTGATFYTSWMFSWHLPRLFNESILRLDIRMHLQGGRVRNHGTGFRIREEDLPQIYLHGESLPI